MGEAHFRLNDIELCSRVDRLSKLNRLQPERIGEVPQNAVHLFALLLLERYDLVVDLDCAERFEIEARAAARTAVDDAGDRRAMLRLDDEHIASVAVADDLVLQIARRVLAAKVRFERRAQPRALLPQLRAQSRQLGARVVVHLARRIDLASYLADLVLER